MTHPGATLAKKLRPRNPARGHRHSVLEAICDDLFRKAAKAGLGIDLAVTSAKAVPMARAEALAALPDLSARFLLNDGAGSLGMIVPDGTVIDAMIEIQTLGRVSTHPRGTRPVTRTDAAMVEPLMTHVIGELAQHIAAGALPDVKRPFALGRAEFDAARLDLTLLSRSYDVVSVTLDLGPGVKSGDVQIWLPGDAGGPVSAACKRSQPRDGRASRRDRG